tara:strand:- start:246 stop:920 length:675 start_codon:yes stop_codon:yes gene_type:complete
MSDIKIKGLLETEREISALRRKLKLSGAQFADIAAQSVRDTVTQNAQPHGKGEKALKQGKNAIRGDFSKIFKVVPDSARGQNGVILSAAEAKRWHKSRRGSRGRTVSGERKRIVLSVYRSYRDSVQARVGLAKGSLTGGDNSGLRSNFQKWISRWSRLGSAARRNTLGGAVWRFEAEPSHVASDNVMGRKGILRVYRAKERNLRNRLRRDLKRNLKKAEKKINR